MKIVLCKGIFTKHGGGFGETLTLRDLISCFGLYLSPCKEQ